jgi:DNA-binding MarR family transcriptional regulator
VEDNRLVRVYLTPEGRKRERAITEQFAKLEGAIFEGIGSEEREQLRQTLRQVLKNMTSLP